MALLVPDTALGGSILGGRKAAKNPHPGWGQARLVHYNSWEGGVVNVLLFSSFPFALLFFQLPPTLLVVSGPRCSCELCPEFCSVPL